jgi:uncharacterized protein YicC (UPF0701 family)
MTSNIALGVDKRRGSLSLAHQPAIISTISEDNEPKRPQDRRKSISIFSPNQTVSDLSTRSVLTTRQGQGVEAVKNEVSNKVSSVESSVEKVETVCKKGIKSLTDQVEKTKQDFEKSKQEFEKSKQEFEKSKVSMNQDLEKSKSLLTQEINRLKQLVESLTKTVTELIEN